MRGERGRELRLRACAEERQELLQQRRVRHVLEHPTQAAEEAGERGRRNLDDALVNQLLQALVRREEK